MSSAASAVKKITAVKLTVVGGPTAGQSFIFDKPMITIGRGSDNDVAFGHDPKMSRNHVELQIYGDKLFVRNISQKNQILLNNEKVQEKAINGTSTLQVGSVTFEIKLAATDLQASNKPVVAKASLPGVAPVSSNTQKTEIVQRMPPPRVELRVEPLLSSTSSKYDERSSQSYNGGTKSNNSGSRTLLYVIVIIIGIAGYWLLNEDSAKKKAEINIRTEADITRAIEESTKTVQEITNSQTKAGHDTVQYKAAQEHYIKGFRDYRQGQYARAQQSFQAALSLYPSHELARKYYVQSQRKFEEQIDRTMSQGRKYYQKNNFRMCQSAFASAMIMIKDSSKAKYKESKQLYDECSLRLEGRF